MNEIKLVHPVMSLIPGPASSSMSARFRCTALAPASRPPPRGSAHPCASSPISRALGRQPDELTISQSGHILSGHYKDQWKAYLNGTSFPLEFDKIQDNGTLTLRPR